MPSRITLVTRLVRYPMGTGSMSIALHSVRSIVRNVVAAWLMACFATCYALPTPAWAKAQTADCCKGHHGACCRKHAGGQAGTAGPVWSARVECAPGCRLPAGVSAGIAPLAAPDTHAVDAAVSSAPLHELAATRPAPHSYFALLYQRPPPSLL